jgi:hypothetical protein
MIVAGYQLPSGARFPVTFSLHSAMQLQQRRINTCIFPPGGGKVEIDACTQQQRRWIKPPTPNM